MLMLDGLDIRQGDFRLTADFALETGRIAAVIGPSGAGKSTLLNVIAGFFAPVAGRVLWDGNRIDALPPGRRPIAMLFQDNNLFPHLSAEQNVGLALSHRRLSRPERERVRAALDRVGLADLGHRKPGALSGGQQSRVALARVLLQDRPLLLLDEPFAALGPGLRREMLSLVRQIAQEEGATILMVSHDPEDARHIAQEVIVVADGTADAPVATGPLFADPPAALRAYLGD